VTDEQARSILQDSEAWIDWDDVQGKPSWGELTIGLNGYFTADQLLAILHFALPGSAMADHANPQSLNRGRP